MNFRSQISNFVFQIARSRRRGAFTFLEVLFAIMVLGVGFILVAAMFPAAIKQTQATVEDSTASSVWISTHRKFIEMARAPDPNAPANAPTQILDLNMKADGKVYSFSDGRISAPQRKVLQAFVGANSIIDTDQRYGCVPLFRRLTDLTNTNGSAEVQLFLIPVHCRNKPQYDMSDSNGALDPTLFTGVKVDRTATITLTNASTDSPAVTGTYILISDVKNPPALKTKNGNVYRLGELQNPGSSPPIYSIAPDAQGATDVYDNSLPATGYTADAFIVGRAYNGTNYEGPAQDLTVVPVPLRVRYAK